MSRAPTASVGGPLLEQAVRQHCRMLKMPTVATQFERLAEVAVRDGHSHVQYLEALLAAELDERAHKAVARRIQEARLPRVKTVQEFDFQQSPVPAARIADLAHGGYIDRAEPVVLIGEAGTGKDAPRPRPVRGGLPAAATRALQRLELICIDELGYV